MEGGEKACVCVRCKAVCAEVQRRGGGFYQHQVLAWCKGVNVRCVY